MRRAFRVIQGRAGRRHVLTRCARRVREAAPVTRCRRRLDLILVVFADGQGSVRSVARGRREGDGVLCVRVDGRHLVARLLTRKILVVVCGTERAICGRGLGGDGARGALDAVLLADLRVRAHAGAPLRTAVAGHLAHLVLVLAYDAGLAISRDRLVAVATGAGLAPAARRLTLLRLEATARAVFAVRQRRLQAGAVPARRTQRTRDSSRACLVLTGRTGHAVRSAIHVHAMAVCASCTGHAFNGSFNGRIRTARARGTVLAAGACCCRIAVAPLGTHRTVHRAEFAVAAVGTVSALGASGVAVFASCTLCAACLCWPRH